MAAVKEVRIPLVPEWANVVQPGDTIVVGLAKTDNVGQVAAALQSTLELLGVNVVVVDNVAQMMVVRPKGGRS